MKIKTKKTFSGKLRFLRVTLSKDESVDYMVAQWLKNYSEDIFVPFTYQEKRRTRLFYDLEDTVPLTTLVKTKLSLGQYERALRYISEVVATTTSLRRSPNSLLMAPEYVFVQDSSALRFIFVPVTQKRVKTAPLELIGWLSDDKNVSLVVDSDMRHVQALNVWAQSQQVFFPERFNEFLDREFSRSGSNDQAHAVYEPEVDEKVREKCLVDPVFLITGAAIQEPTVQERMAESPQNPVPSAGMGQPGEPQGSQDRREAQGVQGAQDTQGTQDTQSTQGTDTSATRTEATSAPLAGGQPHTGPLSIMRVKDGLTYGLTGKVQILGRSQEVDMTFTGNTDISRQHATVELTQQGEVILTDLGSANGTWVEGRRLAAHVGVPLHQGDMFRLAHEWFQLV